MTAGPNVKTIGLAIVVAGMMTGAASGQVIIYRTGPNSAIINTPGSPPVPAYVSPGPGVTYYTVPAQPQPQPFQPNPARQNWQQYLPGNR